MKKYDMAMEVSPDTIPGMMINRIKPGMTVLEFGCAYGRMTKYMSESLHCDVSIVELDQEAYPVARSYAQDGFCGDIDQEGWYLHFSGRQFDRILFADVLEHLRNPLKAIERAKSLLKEDGEILVSIPNIGHNDILVKLFQNRFDYTSIGLLDNTHIHFWGEENLDTFVHQAGCGIRVLDGVYQLPFCTEQKVDKAAAPSELLDLLAQREYNEVYQFFLVLQKKEWLDRHGLNCDNRLKKFYNPLPVYCYWDTGNGYQNNLCSRMVPALMANGKFRFYCDTIPSGCRKVRFDPPIGYHCLVSDIHVSTNVCSCTISPLNGVCVNGVNVFSNTNPQMEFALPPDAQWFEITAFIRICSGVEFGEIFSALQQMPIQAAMHEQQLSTQAAMHEQQLSAQAALHEQQLSQAKDREQTLQEQAKQIQLENISLCDQIEEYSAQQEVFRQHSSWKDSKIEELESLLSQLGQDPSSSPQQAHIANLESRIAFLQASYNELATQYHNVLTSQCWKLTKPLRVILSRFKKTSLGSLPYRVLTAYRESRNQQVLVGNTSVGATGQTAADSAGDLAFFPKTLSQMANEIKAAGGQVFHQEFFYASDIASKKKILLFSHELNLTGAPVALSYLAKALRKQGYFPVIISPHNGTLGNQLIEEGFPIFIYEPIITSDLIHRYATVFSTIVVCTIVGAPIVCSLNGADVPVLWWIHEAFASYHQGTLEAMPETLCSNIHVYSVCLYADRVLKQYRPNYQTSQLLYCVPDLAENLPAEPAFRLKYATGKTVFTIVGVQEERKGQDLLIQAIRTLDPSIRKQCLFVFVGKPFYQPIQKNLMALHEDFPRNVLYIEELSRNDMISLYMQIDCLICASRDDPMPIVVTEAMLMSKAVICSENTGSADILAQMNSGLIYHDNNPEELAQCIASVVTQSKEEFLPMCLRARQTYEKYFTQDVFEQSVKKIFDHLVLPTKELDVYPGKVSVIIPTFNAGDSFSQMLNCLQSQKGVGNVEIVVVDSGSSDGTPERAEQAGAKVIRISQAQFSHSYARNLGAQNATGDFLLFMTQDALPTGSQWMCGLLQPVLHSGVVAVSCQEKPKPDCDLLGKISIWIHSEYMGILETDRIMHLPAEQNYDSLRKNGQLNDVTCLIQREVFLQFKYKGDYAEDLDLGIRLIHAGYNLALLSSVQVIHSHTRPALYHMKRALVDVSTLKKILPDMPVEQITAQTLANRAVTALCALILYIKQAQDRTQDETWTEFCHWSETCFTQIDFTLAQKSQKNLLALLQVDGRLVDEALQDFAVTLFQAYWDHFTLDTSYARSWQVFMTDSVSRYFAAHNIKYSAEIHRNILELLPKYTAQLFGILLSAYSITSPEKDPLLQKMIEQYSNGV